MPGRRCRIAYAVPALCATLALPALPAGAWAASQQSGPGSASGGSSLTGSSAAASAAPSPGGTSSATAPTATESGPVTVTGNGVTLQTSSSAMFRKGLTLSGTAPQNLAGQTVEIQLAKATGWVAVATAAIASDGSFSTTWQANQTGRATLRAVVADGSSTVTAQTASETPALTVTVYRPALATQYGPGFYGHRTACGERLRPNTIGVANRTLKCGTTVSFYYQGRTIDVPVIDRGPYGTKASWDLTEATGRALGLPGTGHIGAASVPAPASAGS